MNQVASQSAKQGIREVWLRGESTYTLVIEELLSKQPFLNIVKSVEGQVDNPQELYFIVYAVDLSVTKQVQDMVADLGDLLSPAANKVVYVLAPMNITQEMMLLMQELGCNYVAFGPDRDQDLLSYIKRVYQERQAVGPLDTEILTIEKCRPGSDTSAVRQTLESLRKRPAGEAVLRLIALGSLFIAETRRAEVALKSLLQLNPQNLWAANQLGKLYLRTDRAALGIETLRKLSQFHDLNGERLLTLGQAATLAGQIDVAEAALSKGNELHGGQDPRFAEGLAKVRLAVNDLEGARSLLGNRSFSLEIISFLNMKAIMAMRIGRFAEAMQYYENAFAGSSDSKLLQAKIKFNMGLAYARRNDLLKAQDALLLSQQLGGQEFQRAKAALATVQKLLSRQPPQQPTPEPNDPDNVDWEVLY